ARPLRVRDSFPTRRSSDLLKSSEAAILSATAFAAITCMSGPPCCPGNTAESIFFAHFSVHRIIPERGPPMVLWMVVETTSAKARSEEHTSELQSRFDLV